jgi:hypothetical protein
MKAPLMGRVAARRFSLFFVLLLAMAAWTYSISAVQEPAEQSTEQTTAKPPAALPGGMEQAHPAPEALRPSPQDPFQRTRCKLCQCRPGNVLRCRFPHNLSPLELIIPRNTSP